VDETRLKAIEAHLPPRGEGPASNAMHELIAALRDAWRERELWMADARRRAINETNWQERADRAERERDGWKAFATGPREETVQALLERAGRAEAEVERLKNIKIDGSNWVAIPKADADNLQAVRESAERFIEVWDQGNVYAEGRKLEVLRAAVEACAAKDPAR